MLMFCVLSRSMTLSLELLCQSCCDPFYLDRKRALQIIRWPKLWQLHTGCIKLPQFRPSYYSDGPQLIEIINTIPQFCVITPRHSKTHERLKIGAYAPIVDPCPLISSRCSYSIETLGRGGLAFGPPLAS
jgi:hypothetical protein